MPTHPICPFKVVTSLSRRLSDRLYVLQHGFTPIHWAAAAGHTQVVQSLLGDATVRPGERNEVCRGTRVEPLEVQVTLGTRQWQWEGTLTAEDRIESGCAL